MSKPIFDATDPRGVVVYFYSTQLQHTLEGHSDEFAGNTVETVQLTVTEPDEILDNLPQPNTPVRTAQERYVRRDGALNTNVVVVAKVVQPGTVLDGVGPVETECRQVWTAHTSYYPPKGKRIWPSRTATSAKKK
jgi:hypothetical protein